MQREILHKQIEIHDERRFLRRSPIEREFRLTKEILLLFLSTFFFIEFRFASFKVNLRFFSASDVTTFKIPRRRPARISALFLRTEKKTRNSQEKVLNFWRCLFWRFSNAKRPWKCFSSSRSVWRKRNVSIDRLNVKIEQRKEKENELRSKVFKPCEKASNSVDNWSLVKKAKGKTFQIEFKLRQTFRTETSNEKRILWVFSNFFVAKISRRREKSSKRDFRDLFQRNVTLNVAQQRFSSFVFSNFPFGSDKSTKIFDFMSNTNLTKPEIDFRTFSRRRTNSTLVNDSMLSFPLGFRRADRFREFQSEKC